jgi:ubiquitin fusion degradation protein 1
MSKDYPVITQGQTIAINHIELNRVFRIDIVETKPAEVISIVNTDLNLDFDEPIDYVPPVKTEPSPPKTNKKVQQFSKIRKSGVFTPFSGTGNRLGS